MESPGFEPGTLRMQSGCDTTTPQSHEDILSATYSDREGIILLNPVSEALSAEKVLPTGLEPVTFRLLAECSNQLSYESISRVQLRSVVSGILTLQYSGCESILPADHQASLAQSVARRSHNPKVVSSILTRSIFSPSAA